MHRHSLQYWSYKLFGCAGLTLAVFALPYLMPGPLLSLYESWPGNPQQRARLTHEYGFDRSLPAQYAIWVQRLVTGHWGTARYSQRPVLQDSWYATCRTLLLLAWTGLLGGLGIALWRGTQRLLSLRLRRSLTLYYVLGAIPGFLVAVLARELMIWQLGWVSLANLPLFEPYYFLNPLYMLIPATVLALAPCRAWQGNAASSPFSGQRPRWSYARQFGRCFRPHLELFFLEVCLIEYVFSFPGLGSLGIEALKRRDIPLFQGFIICLSLLYALAASLCERDVTLPIAGQPMSSRTSGQALLSTNLRAYSNLWCLCILGGLTVGTPWLLQYDPMAIHTYDQFLAPGYRYFFGTDFLGRDIMSRTLKGFNNSIPHVLYLAIILGSVSWFVVGSPRGMRGLLKRAWTNGLQLLQAIPYFVLAFMLFLVFENRAQALDIALVLACVPLAAQIIAGRVSLVHRACQFAQLSERLLILEVIFYFLNLSTESFTPTWGGDIRHGMHYGHINIWMLMIPTLAVIWSRYTFSRVGDTFLLSSGGPLEQCVATMLPGDTESVTPSQHPR